MINQMLDPDGTVRKSLYVAVIRKTVTECQTVL